MVKIKKKYISDALHLNLIISYYMEIIDDGCRWNPTPYIIYA
ncbi:MAG: hypothetical protein ACI4A7_03180 [Prevotella sp.]